MPKYTDEIRHDPFLRASRLFSTLRDRTLVMGILNVTPDSFSDGGRFKGVNGAVKYALGLVKDGAGLIDVGGESTRPGAKPVSVDDELKRVIPVIRALRKASKIPISIDTSKSRVAAESLAAGADIVNDISGLTADPGMAEVIASYKAGVIIMHSKGKPEYMQRSPRYRDLLEEVIKSISMSIRIAEDAGIPEQLIAIDPGIGFGKTVKHNLEILNRLDELCGLGYPICVGTSRKSFIGSILGQDKPSDRLVGTIASSTAAIVKGARIIRVHDVKEAVMASVIADSILNEKVM